MQQRLKAGDDLLLAYDDDEEVHSASFAFHAAPGNGEVTYEKGTKEDKRTIIAKQPKQPEGDNWTYRKHGACGYNSGGVVWSAKAAECHVICNEVGGEAACGWEYVKIETNVKKLKLDCGAKGCGANTRVMLNGDMPGSKDTSLERANADVEVEIDYTSDGSCAEGVIIAVHNFKKATIKNAHHAKGVTFTFNVCFDSPVKGKSAQSLDLERSKAKQECV